MTMEALIQLLSTLNSLSPLAVIALLAIIIFKQVRTRTDLVKSNNEIKDNHLHDMPEMLATLQRIEVKLSEEFSYIRARLNGRNETK